MSPSRALIKLYLVRLYLGLTIGIRYSDSPVRGSRHKPDTNRTKPGPQTRPVTQQKADPGAKSRKEGHAGGRRHNRVYGPGTDIRVWRICWEVRFENAEMCMMYALWLVDIPPCVVQMMILDLDVKYKVLSARQCLL